MKITDFYRTREDGVDLYLTIDALTDEKGEIVYEEIIDEQTGKIWKKPIARGFKIMQNETQTLYSEAIDVENAPYTYSETDIPIEEFTTEEHSSEEELMNDELQ